MNLASENSSEKTTTTLTQKIDGLVFDSFQKSCEIILQGRQGFLESDIPNTDSDILQTISYLLSNWRDDVTHPLNIDILISDPKSLSNNRNYLMERWQFVYKRKDDNKDGRLSSSSRRIVTLLRSLYCFVRLLPGFQLLSMTATTPCLTFRIYNPELPNQYGSVKFGTESSIYDFPKISTFRGVLHIGIQYMNSNILQVNNDIILNIDTAFY